MAKRPPVRFGDYLLVMGVSFSLSMTAQYIAQDFISRLIDESDFISSVLTDSLGGVIIDTSLLLAAGAVGMFCGGIVGGQLIRKQTVRSLLFVSLLVGIGSSGSLSLAFLIYPPLVVAIAAAAMVLTGTIAGFFGYLYAFLMLKRGDDLLDEHGRPLGITKRYYSYLVPGYFLLGISTSGMIAEIVFRWLRAVAWSAIDILPAILLAYVVFGMFKAMMKAHSLVSRESLQGLRRRAKTLRVLLSFFLAVGLPSLLLGVYVLMAFYVAE